MWAVVMDDSSQELQTQTQCHIEGIVAEELSWYMSQERIGYAVVTSDPRISMA